MQSTSTAVIDHRQCDEASLGRPAVGTATLLAVRECLSDRRGTHQLTADKQRLERLFIPLHEFDLPSFDIIQCSDECGLSLLDSFANRVATIEASIDEVYPNGVPAGLEP